MSSKGYDWNYENISVIHEIKHMKSFYVTLSRAGWYILSKLLFYILSKLSF
jgi:hypothetical protein